MNDQNIREAALIMQFAQFQLTNYVWDAICEVENKLKAECRTLAADNTSEEAMAVISLMQQVVRTRTSFSMVFANLPSQDLLDAFDQFTSAPPPCTAIVPAGHYNTLEVAL